MNNVVFLNDYDAMKDAFSQDLFTARAQYGLISVVLKTNSFFDDSGPVWREHRLLTTKVLKKALSRGGGLEEHIKEEVGYLIESLDKTSGQPNKFYEILGPSVLNVICQLVFGHRYQLNDQKLVVLDQFIDTASANVCQTKLLYNSPLWLGSLILRVAIATKRTIIKEMFSIFE